MKVISILLFLLSSLIYSQHPIQLWINNETASFVLIKSSHENWSQTTDSLGFFNYPFDHVHPLNVFYLGEELVIPFSEEQLKTGRISYENQDLLDEMVVSATRTSKFNRNNAVKVGVINSLDIERAQACNLSESLKFQPGLRVENDCQTCNYTQIRMNGLSGAYTQVLVNGRPIFSPLMGLYGLEQLPKNMINKVEIVNGGGSVLYGSAAIGGTINILTELPTEKEASIQYNYQSIVGNSDHQVFANTALISKNNKWRGLLFANYRNREAVDVNKDGFSELPFLENKGVGAMLAYLPKANQKIEWSGAYLNEKRYGGDLLMGGRDEPELARQAEDRLHHVMMSTLDYQINFNDQWSWINYLAFQYTDRKHFTGVQPDSAIEQSDYIDNAPFGDSYALTLQMGSQVNYKMNSFLGGENTWTFGLETMWEEGRDEIKAYQYLLNQNVNSSAAYLQSDWDITTKINLLSGIRLNQNTLLSQMVLTPRIALLYKWNKQWRTRLSWAQGYRAPQAFDTDTHLAFAGGGVSRILINPNIKEESSNSYQLSLDYEKAKTKHRGGFGIDVFYTQLSGSFVNTQIGQDAVGLIFEKGNGQNAEVYGVNLKARYRWKDHFEVDLGASFQRSAYAKAIDYLPEVSEKQFLRAPNTYAYAQITYDQFKNIEFNLSYNYTGSMKILHVAGAPEQSEDDLKNTVPFNEVDVRVAYEFNQPKHMVIKLMTGIKNIANAYQSDFDTTKNRDSNYVYGPIQPRTIFIGVQMKFK